VTFGLSDLWIIKPSGYRTFGLSSRCDWWGLTCSWRATRYSCRCRHRNVWRCSRLMTRSSVTGYTPSARCLLDNSGQTHAP